MQMALCVSMQGTGGHEDDGEDLDEDGDDVDLRLARLENLLERRPILISRYVCACVRGNM